MFEDENQALEEQFEDGGQGGVVDAQETIENPVDDGREGFVDLQGEEGKDGTGAGAGAKSIHGVAAREGQRTFQSHQDNAAARAARLRTEQELRQQYDSAVASFGIPNPYTGKPFQSFEEFKAYGEQYRLSQQEAEAKRQGKTVEALREEEADRDFLRRMRQADDERTRQVRKQEDQAAFMTADLQRFMTEHPEVDVAKLEQNPKFLKFAGKRLYQEPLSELYDDFVELVSDTERSAVAKAAGKRDRSTGSGQGGSGVSLTPGQQADLDAWNRENPEMKMTAKEFLSM